MTSSKTRPTLLDALEERVLLGDGAMGTQLQNAGLESGHCGEAWNVDHPDRVLGIQRRYAEAGSDILLTNTFGAACRRGARCSSTGRICESGVDMKAEATMLPRRE